MSRAELFAVAMHGDQRWGAYPYWEHLARVVREIRTHVPDARSELIEAGWLHDVLEDTTTRKREIRGRFGDDVADLVDIVTLNPLLTRAEGFEAMYRRIQYGNHATEAAILKCADRLVNMRSAMGSLAKRYAQEYPRFREVMFAILGVPESLKTELDAAHAALDA